MLFNWHVSWLICSYSGSVTTITLELRAFSEAPFIPDFKISIGILEADQSPSKRTKTRRVVSPWFLTSQYILVMMPRTLDMIASTTNVETT